MSEEFRRDPYPVYAALREHDPVHHAPMGFWAVTRYDDVVRVLKDTATFSSKAMGVATMNNGRPVRSIINTDPPEHTQIRNLINRAFTPRMVEALEPRIREITRDLLDRALRSGGTVDLVGALAVPLPVTIIAEILGVDADRREDFKRWSDAVVIDSQLAADGPRLQADRAEFWEYVAGALEDRRADPRDDLLSAVLKAEDHEVKLLAEEIVAFAMLLIIAGNETTTNLIGNAMLALLQHPEQMARVRADATLIPNMVEEALRYDSPVQVLFRQTTAAARIGETEVPAGAVVTPVFASANRDERRFPDAGRFDVTRNTQGHVAFGLGPHFCLGAPLARLEARVAFEELFARTREIVLVEQEIVRVKSLLLRGLRRLDLEIEPA
jgi:cytochrome P450